MTQEEFNQMLQVAISQGLFGYYTSAYSNEEMDRAVGMVLGKVQNPDILRNIGAAPNTNLLVNWYFGNPVNQRGQTSYSGAGAYCIDGWCRGYTADAILTVQDGYIEFVGADNAELMQRLEELYLGETVTASVLLQDRTLLAATGTLPSAYSGGYLDAGIGQSIPNTGGAYLGLSYYDNRLRFNFVCPAGSSLKPVAAKLELGDHQTLAYQDDEGNWQLYEVPDYAGQLARCQRYAQVITQGNQTYFAKTYLDANSINFNIPITATMRKGNPTVDILSNGNIRLFVLGKGDQEGFTFTAYNCQNLIQLTASKQNHGITNSDYVFLITSNVLLSLEL